MKITEYINKYYSNNKAAFARSQGVPPQRVTEWVNGEYIVVNGALYSKRRELCEG